jgi:hypothetical protein
MTGAAPPARPVPMPPRLMGSLRASASDLLAHSWRLVVANLAWGVGLLLVLAATSVTPLAWLLTPLLALPTVGIYRIATCIVREEPVSIREGFAAWRSLGARALGVGTVLSGGAAVLVTNLVTGLEARGLMGWSLATFAGWGLVTVGVLAAVVWPLLADPWRVDMGLRSVLRLAALLALAYPVRFGGLALVLLVIVAVSTLAVVAVLSLSIGFSALVASRYVLPAADRFVARLERVPAADGPPRD